MNPDEIKKIIKTIIHDYLKPGFGQAFSGSKDVDILKNYVIKGFMLLLI